MSKHILETIRKLVLSTLFKALPLRSASLDEPDPINNSVDPATDTWLFDASRSVSEHCSEFLTEMGQLSGALGRLHAVVSGVASVAPMHANIGPSAILGAPIWSDDLLFEGHPLASASASVPADTLLFDNEMPIAIDDAVLFDTVVQATL